MRTSKLFAPTLRDNPAEAEVDSHKLLVRAGFIRQIAAGVFAFLPLGLRVLKKIENIIREELNYIGAQEVLLTVLQTKELWQETGRWDKYGEILFRLKDRRGREMALGPTHEEPITDIIRTLVKSYRELPIALYQIQTKFRDELRPRFGLIRCREFLMKDLYSFHDSPEDLTGFYSQVSRAYERIFSRLGLTYHLVEADPGTIGGTANHEFLVPGLSGESQFFICKNCGYKATSEKVSGKSTQIPTKKETEMLNEIYTPKTDTIEKLSAFLNVEPQDIVKTMTYIIDGKPTVILIRGDYEVNETKVANTTSANELRIANEMEVSNIFSSPVGFLGPIKLPKEVKVLVDETIYTISSGIVGANKEDYHLSGFNPQRDLPKNVIVGDFRNTLDGDLCTHCNHPLKEMQGMEVGHVFNLGNIYSKAMKAVFTNKGGKDQEYLMGCYGIGISRTLQAIAEEHHDEFGLSWTISSAPYQVIIVPIDYRDKAQKKVAENLYRKLLDGGVEVIIDDRELTPGIKFNDADLIGYPIRINISSKTIKQESVEVMLRKNHSKTLVNIDDLPIYIKELINNLFKEIEEKTPDRLTT